jgi:hypothetical protein
MAFYDCKTLTIAEAGSSDSFDTGRASGRVWVQVAGDLVGTVELEVTLDGVKWQASSLAALAAGQYVEVPELTRAVRLNCSAYTSGTMSACVGFAA